MHKELGSTWIATIDGKQWPVVLCGDEVAPPAFVAMRKDPAYMPAIQLGRHRYVFVHDQRLEAIDPHKDYLKGTRAFDTTDIRPDDSLEDIQEKKRHMAFAHDAIMYKDHHFWANYLANQSAARRLERERKGPYHTPQKQQDMRRESAVMDLERRENQSPRFVPHVKRRKLDSKMSSHQLLTPTKTPRKPAYRKDPITGVIEISDGDDESQDDDLDDVTFPVTPLSGRKRKAEDSSGVRPSIEDDSGSAKKERCSMSPASLLASNLCRVTFAHGDRDTMALSKNIISKCAFLNNRKSDDENATELDLTQDKHANHVRLTASDIDSVAQYYLSGDMSPRFVNNTASGQPLLSRVDVTPKRKNAHAELLGRAFVTAVKIEDEALQALVLEKLRALYPLRPLSILIMAGLIANLPEPVTETQDAMATWVLDHVVQCFWVLAKKHVELLQKTLERNDAMRKGVFDSLKDDPLAGKLGYIEENDDE